MHSNQIDLLKINKEILAIKEKLNPEIRKRMAEFLKYWREGGNSKILQTYEGAEHTQTCMFLQGTEEEKNIVHDAGRYLDLKAMKHWLKQQQKNH